MNYYNDNDSNCTGWIENLIAKGLLPPGDVDGRSITDVKASDLEGYQRVALFAGIAGWERALQLAGWPEDEEVWSISCPCPILSCAGKRTTCPECGGSARAGSVWHPYKTGTAVCCDEACGHQWFADERHLWPEAFRLIAAKRPRWVFGEQVASKDAIYWIAGVRAQMEAAGYAFWSPDLPAACAGETGYQISHGWVGEDKEEGEAEVHWDAFEDCIVGAPHIRQRLFWGGVRVADTECRSAERYRHEVAGTSQGVQGEARERERVRDDAGDGITVGGLADPKITERRSSKGTHNSRGWSSETGRSGSFDSGLADAFSSGIVRPEVDPARSRKEQSQGSVPHGRGTVGVGHPDSSGRDRPGLRVPVRQQGQTNTDSGGPSQSSGARCGTDHWSRFSCIPCADGKTRRIPEPQRVFQCVASGLLPSLDQLRPEEGFPLATGVEGRTTKLRGIGNSIVPQLAAIFIEEFLAAVQEVLP